MAKWLEVGPLESPKHQGAFDYRNGEPLRLPPCVELKTHPAKLGIGRVCIDVG